ncbi:hypothetical protein AC249_AIPGENE14592 [Exaiptasia diaphana]|nr:hypothetical protein AC249_AIPGENE14592 [Exaiptasia diaphana]
MGGGSMVWRVGCIREKAKKEGKKKIEGWKVFNVLDPNKKGYANKDDIMALTVDKLKAIADIVDPDYANTEEYEHVLFGEAEVRDAFQDALEEGNGELHLQKLIQKYKDLGGSEKVARELFAMLKPKSKDKATADEVEENLANVLELYKKIRDDDKSGIFYDRHLQEDKEIMAKTLDGKKDTDGTKHEEL